MRLVENYGSIWRLTNENYIKLLETIAAGSDYYLNQLGKKIGQIDLNPLDLTAEFAAEELASELRKNKRGINRVRKGERQ